MRIVRIDNIRSAVGGHPVSADLPVELELNGVDSGAAAAARDVTRIGPCKAHVIGLVRLLDSLSSHNNLTSGLALAGHHELLFEALSLGAHQCAAVGLDLANQVVG